MTFQWKKMSKKNETIYTVVRIITSEADPLAMVRYRPVVLDSWKTYESAEQSCWRYEADMEERNIQGLKFTIQSSNLYNE